MDFRKVKAVLFDLDGTLLDTIKDIGTCINDVMCRYGYPTRPIREYIPLVGQGAKNLVRSSLPAEVSEEKAEEVFQTYVSHYRENFARLTDAYPGITEFVAELVRRGYQVGLITNKTQATAERIMGKYFPDTPFAILWGNDYRRPLKPAPESGALACEALHCKPEEVVFVGDGDTDMEFAVNCGFFACGVTWGYRDRETLRGCGAQLLIDSIDQLAEKLFA